MLYFRGRQLAGRGVRVDACPKASSSGTISGQDLLKGRFGVHMQRGGGKVRNGTVSPDSSLEMGLVVAVSSRLFQVKSSVPAPVCSHFLKASSQNYGDS